MTKKPEPSEELLLWLDLETTDVERPGVTLDDIVVLEVGVILTDLELRELDVYSATVLNKKDHVDFLRLKAPDPVREMHARNGLWDEVERYGIPLADAERAVVSLVDQAVRRYGIENPRIYLAGSGVAAFDRGIVRYRMPDLNRRLYYRPADVGQFAFFVEKFLGSRVAHVESPELPHRSIGDLRAAIERLRLFVEALA